MPKKKISYPSVNLKNANHQLLLIIIGGFLIRLAALTFSQVTDSDVVSRLFIAEEWLQNPHFIYEGVWLPFHHYFNALAIAISGEHIISPKLFHIVLSCLTVIPLYHFTKREFSSNSAWFSVVLFILCPIVFRNSFHALSEIPHIFFVALAINNLSKSIRYNSAQSALLAGLYITIAAGFRYESWLLIAVYFGIFLLFRRWKLSFYFLITATVFPLFWMLGNYMEHGHILFGVPGNYNQEIVAFVNSNANIIEKVKRIIFFPFIWFYAFSPILVLILGWQLLRKIKKRELIKSRLIWSIPFWIVLFVFMYKAFEGTLLLQNRFSILLILLSAPFASLILEKIQWSKFKKLTIGFFIVTLLPLSYIWMQIPVERLFTFSYTINTSLGELRAASQNTFKAVPRLWRKDYISFSEKINDRISKDSGLILDFISWDNTYFLAYNTQLPQSQILIVSDSKQDSINKMDLQILLKNSPKGIIMLKCHSNLSKVYDVKNNILTFNTDTHISLQLTPVIIENGMSICEYEVVRSHKTKAGNSPFNCPEENSLDHVIFLIKNNDFWTNDIKRKAVKNKISFQQQLLKDAQLIADKRAGISP